MILLINDTFSFTQTLLIALTGAVIGQLSILTVSVIRKKIDLNKKKKLIKSDLKNQRIILKRLEEKLVFLNQKLDTRDDASFSGDIFHDLQNEIYQSVPKVELYKIFKEDITKLVDIYGSILFLKEQNPHTIYERYVTDVNRHIQEEKDDPQHKLYCGTHLGFIRIAQNQIESNLKTIVEVNELIKSLID